MAVAAKVTIKAMSIVIGIPVGIATRKLVEQAWIVARPDDPPRKPSDAQVRWSDALAWGVISAAGIVVSDMVTRRTAQAAFKAITGNEPPPGKPSKASKVLAKASKKSNATAD